MRTMSFQFIAVTVGLCLIGCSGTDNSGPPPGAGGDQSVGGSTGVGGNTSTAGGSLAAGGSVHVGGGASTGGAATGGSMAATGGNALGTGGATGGSPQTGGSKAVGGTPATGGSKATGGAVPTGGMPAAGGAATGGMAATGGAATGGKAATGGSNAAGGAATGGTKATGGSATTGGAAAGGGPNCSATMPTGGTVHQYTGNYGSDNGTADGLGWGMWSSGTGGSITVFTNVQAFAASWNNSADFLAHLGLDFNATKNATAYTSIVAQFVETKSGTAGGWSSIGMYGWMHSPCIEWYINEDSFNGLHPSGSTTVTIDGATYYLTTSQTTGTGGANACESGHTGGWTNITSTRASAHTCGTVTVSDHFKAWAAQGWSLGTLASVHINVETGGGTGSIQFPVANVTAN